MHALSQVSDHIAALATVSGADAPAGPGTITWRTWAAAEHLVVDVYWRTFADAMAARTANLVGLSLLHDTPNGVLVCLEANGSFDDAQRCLPLSRITCLRTHSGDVWIGADDTAAMDRHLLADAAGRWLHSTAKDAKVIDKHARTFAELAARLSADASLQHEVQLACVQAAKDAAAAQSRLDALSG